MSSPLIAVENLSKSFGATRALSHMTLAVNAGTVHAVMGENGAGKSTLMKLLSGVFAPDEGQILLDGKAVSFSRPRDAQEAGISTIFQEFSLLPNLSVAENLFLGRETENGRRLSRTEMNQRTQAALTALDMDIDPDVLVGALGVGQQQMVEIAKGVLADASVFIFDEPTAALATHEVETLFKLIRRLAGEGKAVFYISHRLSEIFAICDEITIMKDGSFVRTVPARTTTADEVIEGMVGRPLEELFSPRNATPGDPLLVADQLVGSEFDVPTSINIHKGEIVGIAGLEGQGQQALMRLLAGFDTAVSGDLSLDGKRIERLQARRRMAMGVGFVPESRKDDGLFPSLDILANMETAAVSRRGLFGWVRSSRARVDEVMAHLNVKASSARQNVMSLSGGNQQKVVLGRWFVSGAKVLLCEEPTRGVDVGAKREIYFRLREFTNAGNGVLVTSRELPELIGLCDRVLVIRDGVLVADFPAQDATEDALLREALPPMETEVA